MAYATAGLKLIAKGIGSGPKVFNYSSADARATVEAANYFTDGLDRGMKAGDTVIVVVTGTFLTTIHSVTESSADGATINAAVLA
jgi:hypothetical protein